MNSGWLESTILRTASFLAPGARRAAWLEEWRAELWYVPRDRAARFCLGAFRDALWVRQSDSCPESPLESPASCLAFLAVIAVVSLVLAASLLTPLRLRTALWRLSPRDLPAGCMAMLVYTGVFLPVTRMVMGQAATHGCPAPWRSKLRRMLFMAAKVALIQPVMLCGLFLMILVGPVLPFAPCAIPAAWILAFRWLIADQRQRCPVCLRRLTDPIRLGAPSRTFLDWYGADSMCLRGHGLLHAPEISTSYSGSRQWVRLDASWSVLFSETAGARHP